MRCLQDQPIVPDRSVKNHQNVCFLPARMVNDQIDRNPIITYGFGNSMGAAGPRIIGKVGFTAPHKQQQNDS